MPEPASGGGSGHGVIRLRTSGDAAPASEAAPEPDASRSAMASGTSGHGVTRLRAAGDAAPSWYGAAEPAGADPAAAEPVRNPRRSLRRLRPLRNPWRPSLRRLSRCGIRAPEPAAEAVAEPAAPEPAPAEAVAEPAAPEPDAAGSAMASGSSGHGVTRLRAAGDAAPSWYVARSTEPAGAEPAAAEPEAEPVAPEPAAAEAVAEPVAPEPAAAEAVAEPAAPEPDAAGSAMASGSSGHGVTRLRAAGDAAPSWYAAPGAAAAGRRACGG